MRNYYVKFVINDNKETNIQIFELNGNSKNNFCDINRKNKFNNNEKNLMINKNYKKEKNNFFYAKIMKFNYNIFQLFKRMQIIAKNIKEIYQRKNIIKVNQIIKQ